MNFEIYDKVKWHFPEGEGCKSLEDALLHFKVIMNWLYKNNLLSEFGSSLYRTKYGEDFSITSEMLNDRGNQLLSKCYDGWQKTIIYGNEPSTESLDKKISEL